jgi:hypothetical protein
MGEQIHSLHARNDAGYPNKPVSDIDNDFPMRRMI